MVFDNLQSSSRSSSMAYDNDSQNSSKSASLPLRQMPARGNNNQVRTNPRRKGRYGNVQTERTSPPNTKQGPGL